MSAAYRTKALLIAASGDPIPVQVSINRLVPELLCFVVSESRKASIASDVQPAITTVPKRWDWILTDDAGGFHASHQCLTQHLPDMMKTWGLRPGELVVDFSGADPAMAAAMALASRPWASQIVLVTEPTDRASGKDAVECGGRTFAWETGNPWNEEAGPARRDAALLFNHGAFAAAAQQFRRIEALVGGSLNPLYHSLGTLADGYACWEGFKYRDAWDKLKTATKTLELASVWGGPPGMTAFLSGVKQNLTFLERIVMDPHDIKLQVAHDLLAHAKRRAERDRHIDLGIHVLWRALEAYAQHQLWTRYQITSQDVRIDALPRALQDTCRACYASDVDGKFRLPLHAQLRTLAELGHPMGRTFVQEWPKMKTLWDAAHHSVLGHGFQTLNADRFAQCHAWVITLTNIPSHDMPTFPRMTL